MSNVIKSAAVGALVALLAAGAVNAATFTGSFGVSGDALSDPGLVVKTYPSGGPVSFDLDVGESATFKLFDIWTDEADVGGDDRLANRLAASFTLTDPVASGSMNGDVKGHDFVFGLLEWGSLTWGDKLELAFGKGGLLTIDLSDAIFNKGLFGLNEGKKHGATVYATATYEVAPVPLPAGLGLLAGALGALGVARRLRRKS